MHEQIKSIIRELGTIRTWQLKLLSINESNEPEIYTACEVELDPVDELNDFVFSILKKYWNEKKSVLNKYKACVPYDGNYSSDTIYTLSTDCEVISTQYRNLANKLSNASKDINPITFDAKAYVITANLKKEKKTIPIKLISMQSPLTTIKHRFWYQDNVFKRIEGKSLHLKETIDVCIIGKDIYFFDMKGEDLFAMERAYKTMSKRIIDRIENLGICSDNASFISVANSGFNPRRFMTFNEVRLNALSGEKKREDMIKKFKLIMTDEGTFDTSDPQNAERLIKVLCNKGMTDPFDDIPVEVPSSSSW